MQNAIYLSEVLVEMKKLDANKIPIPFSISVRTFERKKIIGGKIKYYQNATLMQEPPKKGVKRLLDSTDFKNPKHFDNRTRNIKDASGIHKINILFIISFNGKQVVY